MDQKHCSLRMQGADLIFTLFAGSEMFKMFWKSSFAGKICSPATNQPKIASWLHDLSISNVYWHMVLYSTETGIDGQGTAAFSFQLSQKTA